MQSFENSSEIANNRLAFNESTIATYSSVVFIRVKVYLVDFSAPFS